MYIDAASSDDFTFASDDFGPGSHYQIDMGLNIGVSSFADCGDKPVLDPNVGLDDSPMIENHRIGDHGIQRALTSGALRLAHAIPDHLPAPKLHFLAIAGEVLLDFDNEAGICKAQLIAYRRTKHLRVRSAAHCERHAKKLRGRQYGAVRLPTTSAVRP